MLVDFRYKSGEVKRMEVVFADILEGLGHGAKLAQSDTLSDHKQAVMQEKPKQRGRPKRKAND